MAKKTKEVEYPKRRVTASTLAVLGLPLAILATASCYFLHSHHLLTHIAADVGLSVLGFILTVTLIPTFKPLCAKAKAGKDLNKPGAKEDKPLIPESLGIVPGTIYLICIILLQLLYGTPALKSMQSMLVEYNAALHSICFMLFLGFADDVMDLRWRYKLVLPSIATLPLLVAYSGGTSVIVPIPLRGVVGNIVDLGILYQVYMGLLAVFCTNAINIYAGINGLEAGQSFIIACAIGTHNVVELSLSAEEHINSYHLFSLLFILPFIAVTLGLLVFNWYPSEVFVGDTFTYFCGIVFAVVGISGHFSKTLLLFFIPQIVNFLISLPQLFRIIPCPRHRIPRYDPKLKKLVSSKNYTLINLFLEVLGPMEEEKLVQILLLFQVATCAFAFYIRYSVAGYFY